MKKADAKSAYRLLLEYDGGRYHGWQKQGERQTAQGIRTVTGTLERVLQEAGYRVLALAGAGRTDIGVHAAGQVAHLHLGGNRAPTAAELQRKLDEGLPADVAVRSISACSPAFHARHDAMERSYLYQISLRRSAFGKPYLWWVKGQLNLAALETTWQLFEGQHDMAAFADLEPGEDSRCQIRSCECVHEGSLILLRITARHFLRRQARRLVGAAVLCGLGREKPETVDRDLMKPTPQATLHWAENAAPSSGLFLEYVRYSGDPELPEPKALIPVR
jgi:tRNA pseudouridine38-40 synthase